VMNSRRLMGYAPSPEGQYSGGVGRRRASPQSRPQQLLH
jgi:hypothetical protein